MTVVLADTQDETLIFAADSAASNGDEIYTVDTPKVFALGSYLFGYTGSYRIGQILRHYVELPEPPEREAERFLVREVVPILRAAVLEQGAAGPGQDFLGEKTALLVGFRSRIWCIGTDLTVTPEAACAPTERSTPSTPPASDRPVVAWSWSSKRRRSTPRTSVDRGSS